MEAFRDRLLNSDPLSIDRFLESNTDQFQAIGKAAITYAILRAEHVCEKEHKLVGKAPEDHWLRWMWDRLRKGCDAKSLKENSVVFATFNYDRILEHYFVGRIENSYNVTREEARDIQREAIPVVHLYGQIDGPEFGDFNTDVIAGVLPTYANGIRVIHDDVASDDQNFRRVRTAISGADEIVCLGVGYDAVNMNRLKLQGLRPNVRGIGSVYDLAPAEVDLASAAFGFQLEHGHAEYKCEAFLRAVARLE